MRSILLCSERLFAVCLCTGLVVVSVVKRKRAGLLFDWLCVTVTSVYGKGNPIATAKFTYSGEDIIEVTEQRPKLCTSLVCWALNAVDKVNLISRWGLVTRQGLPFVIRGKLYVGSMCVFLVRQWVGQSIYRRVVCQLGKP